MLTKTVNLLDVIFRVLDKLQYEVSEEDIVTVLIKQDHIIHRFFRKLRVKIPEYQRITMDEFGNDNNLFANRRS